ncbi:MAG TPA: hypothetical protein VG268_15870 [Streptosporangiaceae bacterium]|nr:hypothetical protein [Streptosporangiaceae bacterium]
MTGLEIMIRASATSATGMLTQKIARQVHWVRNPPSSGPIAVRPPAMPKNSASALPRSRSGNVCTTMASAAGNMIAPPAPWTTRKATIHASARLPLGVSPHSAGAAAKMITPSVTIFRWPSVSASRPPNANSAASDSR